MAEEIKKKNLNKSEKAKNLRQTKTLEDYSSYEESDASLSPSPRQSKAEKEPNEDAQPEDPHPRRRRARRARTRRSSSRRAGSARRRSRSRRRR